MSYAQRLAKAFTPRVLTLQDTLDFGKYKGGTIENIVKEDPSYIQWVIDKTETRIDDEAFVLLQDRLTELQTALPSERFYNPDCYSDFPFDKGYRRTGHGN